MLIDEISKPINRSIMTLSAYSIQGRRTHMEDYFDIGYQMKPCDQQRPDEWPFEYFYFGIFDGHGGYEAAEFAKRNLVKFITRQADFWSDDDEDVMRAIRKGYADTHDAMRQNMSEWCRTSRVLPSTAGTTASVLFIRNGKFYSGHVGDSRIIISQENVETKQWIARRLTQDHKPEFQSENERIQRAGGEVKSKFGVHRVVWRRPVLIEDMESKSNAKPESPEYDSYLKAVSHYPVSESLVDCYQVIPFLAIARSLGDFWSLNPYSGQYVVSPEPDVSCRLIYPNDKGILLATDGLWNVMNSTQVVRFLQELDIMKNNDRKFYEDKYFSIDNFYDVAGEDSENHAQSLVYFAHQIWERKRLRSDNITVVVAMLHDVLSSFNSKVGKHYATRASLQTGRQLSTHSVDDKLTRLVQLDKTNSYYEKITLDKEPEFLAQQMDQKQIRNLSCFEQFLQLPPTMLELELCLEFPKPVYPRNYMRLSVSDCRKIIYRTPRYGYIDVYIKTVSDDPADEQPLPVRTNKAGKEVRDSSAQATQSMHDFGQPWNQLLNNRDINDEDIEEQVEIDEDVGDTTELVLACGLGSIDDYLDDDDAGDDDDEDDDHHMDDVGESLEELTNKVDLENKKSSKEDSNIIPQLRCLLNKTPPRRSNRSTKNYVSMSENSKRKVQTSPVNLKPKRRKSQPIRYMA